MEDPLVELRSGFVRGIVEKHEEGFSYYAFKGIPYAEPPVGELRFKDSLPIKKWTGVIDCTNYGPMCLQFDFFTKVKSYNENCLHLNIFTRTINNPKVKQPVIVVIHGGAYMFSSCSDLFYGPDHLIRKNIVLVTFNFRLGVLGFLDLEDEIAPGNQGLKDQVMVLKWVQQNAKAFGGDPGNVTVFGVSAGGSSAHYLAISPLTKGLIHKVISQCSVAYNSWFAVNNSKSNAVKLCSLLGKNLTDPKEMFAFLQMVDPKMLQEAQELLRASMVQFPFGPGVDSKSSNPFMPVHRDILANEGVHLPYLLGHTSHQGLLLIIGDIFRMCDENLELIRSFHGDEILARHRVSSKQVRRFYCKRDDVTDENMGNFVELVGDLYFVEGIHKLAKVQSKRSSASTYLYAFSYDSPNSISRAVLKNAASGVMHLDEIPYILKVGFLEQIGVQNLKRGTQDYRIMEQMTEMWTNFARYGRPTIETSELIPVHWKPIADGTLLRYLNIDEDITMKVCVNVDQKYLSARSIKE